MREEPTVAVSRRRSARDDEPDEREERPSRRRRGSDDMPDEERNSPRRSRSRDRDEEPEEEERPSRGRRNRSSDEDEKPSRRHSRGEDERPSRRRSRGSSEDEGRGSRRRGTSGFGSYSSKKASTGGSYADDFKVKHNEPVLIKILDPEPFDSYNQHWIDDMPKGERKSYVCLDDDYFGPEDERDECPLCEIGEKQKTFALFNVVDLSNPRKPEVKVWSASPAVADLLERASKEKKTSPINRDDLYWEAELQKKGQKYNWVVTPVKARDLGEDYDMDPLENEEIEEFENDMFEDRSAVTKVDTYDDLRDLADDLMK
jgi:hypothetical protein